MQNHRDRGPTAGHVHLHAGERGRSRDQSPVYTEGQPHTVHWSSVHSKSWAMITTIDLRIFLLSQKKIIQNTVVSQILDSVYMIIIKVPTLKDVYQDHIRKLSLCSNMF